MEFINKYTMDKKELQRIKRYLNPLDRIRVVRALIDKLIQLEETPGQEGPQGPPGPAGADGADGADGFGTEVEYNDLIARIEALEALHDEV